MPVPVITQTCRPSVTGDGDDMFCFICRRLPPPSSRFHRTAPVLRSTRPQVQLRPRRPRSGRCGRPRRSASSPTTRGIASFQVMFSVVDHLTGRFVSPLMPFSVRPAPLRPVLGAERTQPASPRRRRSPTTHSPHASVHRGHSDRSDASSGARVTARAATAEDNRPATNTANSSSSRRRRQRPPAAALRDGRRNRQAGARPRRRARPTASSTTFSASTIVQKVPAPVADGAEQRQLRAAARARCAAAPWPGRRCRAAARARRASGTSTGRCSRPGGTPRAARPCGIASAPKSASASSIAGDDRVRAVRRRLDERRRGTPPASGNSAQEIRLATSAARPERCCRAAPPRAAAGSAGRCA